VALSFLDTVELSVFSPSSFKTRIEEDVE